MQYNFSVFIACAYGLQQVLFESRVVHGYSALEVIYLGKPAAPVSVVEERATVQSFFFKQPAAQPKLQEPPKEKAISCELERLKGEFTLEPGIYSLRHLKCAALHGNLERLFPLNASTPHSCRIRHSHCITSRL